jgi:hypothetical protein
MNNFIDYHKPETRKGELMKQDKPLIDYVNNHKRCDDDLRLADRLATASKYIGIGLFCFAAWFVVLDLTFKALEMM